MDIRDPEHQEYNAALYPVDDPPVCERLGCGHLIGLHRYTPRTRQHSTCGACACHAPLSPWDAA